MDLKKIPKTIEKYACKFLTLGVILWLAAKWLIIEPNLEKEKIFDFWTIPHLLFGIVSGMCCSFPYQFFLLIFWELGEYAIEPNLWLLSWDNNVFDVVIGILGLFLAYIFRLSAHNAHTK